MNLRERVLKLDADLWHYLEEGDIDDKPLSTKKMRKELQKLLKD